MAHASARSASSSAKVASGSISSARPPLLMKSATCCRVAAEQLPETIARAPRTGGKASPLPARKPNARGRPTPRPDAATTSRLQDPQQVGVCHRCQGMRAHRTVGQQRRANEQVTEVNATTARRKCRRYRDRPRRQIPRQRFSHRADVARRRGVERRTDLEIDLGRPLRCEPARSRQRVGYGLGDRRGAAFQADDRGIDVVSRPLLQTDAKRNPHPASRKVVGEVGRTRQIIGDATKSHDGDASSAASRRQAGEVINRIAAVQVPQ